jgi:hypothetical protein
MRSIAYSLRHHDSHASPGAKFFRYKRSQRKQPKEYFDRRIAQLQKNDVDGAITDLSRAINLNPRYAGWWS